MATGVRYGEPNFLILAVHLKISYVWSFISHSQHPITVSSSCIIGHDLRSVPAHECLLLCLLVNPVELSALVLVELLRLKPQGNLLLCTLDCVGAVAHIATNIDGVVTANGSWGGCEWVGGSEDHYEVLVTVN
jgi:hypothetical protein